MGLFIIPLQYLSVTQAASKKSCDPCSKKEEAEVKTVQKKLKLKAYQVYPPAVWQDEDVRFVEYCTLLVLGSLLFTH